jgi:fatty acid-binding protein DegV
MANSSAIRVFSSGGAASTPTADTKAVQAHGNELETALRLLDSESAAFAKSVIVDPAARMEYTNKTKAAAAELIELVRQRKMTPHEGASNPALGYCAECMVRLMPHLTARRPARS